jgi:uncharacterized oligopeptide transporter (OPT) family protein
MNTKKNIDTPLSAMIILMIFIALLISLGFELILAMDEGWYDIPIRKHYFIYKVIGLILFIPFCALIDKLIVSSVNNYIQKIKINRAVKKVIKRQRKNNGYKNYLDNR